MLASHRKNLASRWPGTWASRWARLAALAGAIVLLLQSPAFAGFDRYWHLIGVLHPALVHFPIGLLLPAAFIEFLRIWKKPSGLPEDDDVLPVPGETAMWCLALGAIGASASAIVGWALADAGGDYQGHLAPIMWVHRWGGVALCGLTLGTLGLACWSRREPDRPVARWSTRGGIFACAALCGLVGNFGGKLTYGPNHYGKAWDRFVEAGQPDPEAPPPEKPEKPEKPAKPVRPVVANPDVPATKPGPDKPGPENPGTAPAIGAAGDKVDFHKQIWPIFEKRCIECHGPEKVKGKYRMDTRELAMKRGDNDMDMDPIVPGKADVSLLLLVCIGEGDYKDMIMPPKGKPLDKDQLDLLRRWINQGADWPAK